MKKGKSAEKTVEKVVVSISDDELLAPYVPEEEDGEKAENPAPAPAAPQNTMVMMSAADIAVLVKEAAVAAATAIQQTGTQGLGTAIGDEISRAMTRHLGAPQANIAGLVVRTPFNPTGRKRDLKKDFVHNGCTIHERFVSDEEIELLHEITPGTYGTEDFPILVSEKKVLGGKPKVHILYRESKDDRLRIKNYAPTFHALLAKLVVEAKEQRAQRRSEAKAFLEATD